MIRHVIARGAFGAAIGALAVLAGFLIDPSSHAVEADTNVDKSGNISTSLRMETGP